MAIGNDMLKRIMGAPNSPTGRLVSLRRTPPEAGELETGVWYSSFTRVKSEAEQRGIPFFAMWTNGDLCGFCQRFTRNILAESFLEKMRSSGGLWWLGGSMDESEDDRRGGIGFNWCMGPDKHVHYFPFFTAARKVKGDNALGFFGSGGDYDQSKEGSAGTKAIIAKIHDALRFPDALKKGAVPEQDTQRSTAGNGELRIRSNPAWDPAHVARFQAALRENGGYCPCRSDKNDDTRCMCRDFTRQDHPGSCRCGAFEKYRI